MCTCPHHKVFDQDCNTCMLASDLNVIMKGQRSAVVLAPAAVETPHRRAYCWN